MSEQTPTADAPETGKPAVFTQEQVNAFVADAKRKTQDKFSDYDDLKTQVTDLSQQLSSFTQERDSLTKRVEEAEAVAKTAEVARIRATVAASMGVPLNLLTADTEDDCRAQASALLEFAAQKTTPAPSSGVAGDPTVQATPLNSDALTAALQRALGC
ncbi:hypothetical protein ACUH96_00895 [Dermabacteraceae bacterium P13077]